MSSYEPYQPADADPPPVGERRACPACGAASFEPGFVEDAGESSQGYARWIPGPLERGVFGGAKKWGKQRYAIEADRCARCGHLMLFARTQV